MVPCSKMWLITLIVIIMINGSIQGPSEKALLKLLFEERGFNSMERPSKNDSLPLMVYLKFTLQQIIDVDEKNQIIHTNAWLDLAWNDYSLTWDPEKYGGITKIILSPKKVWRPDLLLYNSADDTFDATFATNVVVSHTGDISFIPPGMFKSTCKIDITWFPFDDQRCHMKFGTWTHDGTKINLTYSPAGSVDISTYTENGEWDLVEVPKKRTVLKYECCPEPYIDITYTLHIRRRTLYFGFNLMIPCVLISTMAVLTFSTPPDAGEKISLGVTILLSLTVFLLLVAEAVPPTSDAVPLIGVYFACIMMMCSLSVVFTVLVLNYHHRSARTHDMPTWVKKGICEWLAWALRMRRPGKELSRLSSSNKDSDLKDKSSKSLLANVIDLEDNIRRNVSSVSLGGVKLGEENYHVCSTLKELRLIINELSFITERMKSDDDGSEILSDWKFAAAVIDKLCLYTFTLFTLISTFAIIFSAPRLI